MNDSKYVLDANVFIQSHKGHYAFDLAPGFWESLIKHSNEGRIVSIDWVRNELKNKNDILSEWIKKEFTQAFTSTDRQDVISAYSEIMNWVNNHNQYLDYAKEDFASHADPWLIAYALSTGYILVTEEIYDAKIKRKIPIPNVCKEFNVEYLHTFDMLRRLGVKFVCI